MLVSVSQVSDPLCVRAFGALVAVTLVSAPIGARAQFACAGTLCFAGPATCEEYRSHERDEGDDPGACRSRESMHCVTATDHYSGEDLTWCATTAGGCRTRIRELQRANRARAVHLYDDLSECFLVEWDGDEDGFAIGEDDCPDEPGTVVGCPDTDGDHVRDSRDDCPSDFGSVGGCPDDDGDLVPNRLDACPSELGRATYEGCPPPDTDGDGADDLEDLCPAEVGPASGCPDADADGVRDRDDRCIDAAGTAHGCPDEDGDGYEDANDACPAAPVGPHGFAGCPDADRDRVPDACFNVRRAIASGMGSEAEQWLRMESRDCGHGEFRDRCLNEREDSLGAGLLRNDGCPTR